MISPGEALIETCEEIANSSAIPAFMVDWACDLYDSLMSRDDQTTVRVSDLMVLDTWLYQGREAGLFALDALLARRSG
jgi:hypothetical protein